MTEEEKVQTENNDWQNWGWEGASELSTTTEKEEVKEFIDITAEEKDTTIKKEKEVDLFAEDTLGDEVQPTTETKEIETNTKTTEDGEEEPELFNTLAKVMKDKGVFQNVEIKDDEDIDEEKFIELQDQEIESRVEETIENFFEEMDEDAKAFINFKKNGGSTQDFLNVYANSLSLDDIDLTDEDDQERIVRYYLKIQEGEDSDVIEDKIAWLKENKKLSNHAEKYDQKLKDIDRKNKEALINSQKEAEKNKIEATKKFREILSKEVETKEKIKDITISKDDKSLVDYITKPTAKLGTKYIPPFNVALGEILQAKTPETREKLILLAKILKSDFDISKDIEKKAETKIAQKAKTGLSRFINPDVTGTKPSRGGDLASTFS